LQRWIWKFMTRNQVQICICIDIWWELSFVFGGDCVCCEPSFQ
jgi:hypothetical protein